jgi:hypothetical protein
MFEEILIERIEGRIAAPGRADERSFLRPCLDVGAGLSREASEGYVRRTPACGKPSVKRWPSENRSARGFDARQK